MEKRIEQSSIIKNKPAVILLCHYPSDMAEDKQAGRQVGSQTDRPTEQ